MDLFDRLEKQRRIKRDGGEEVHIVDIPLTRAYSNPEMGILSSKYDVYSHCGWQIPSSLGRTETELYAAHLFRTYQFIGRFCGFVKKELEEMGEQTGYGSWNVKSIEDLRFLKAEMVEGVNVLFPTEGFLKNQKVKKRK